MVERGSLTCGSAPTPVGAMRHAVSAQYRHTFRNEPCCTEAPYERRLRAHPLIGFLQPAGTGLARSRVRQV